MQLVSVMTEPALLVRGSSRRIMSMRFRPANIRMIDRRANRLDRYLCCRLFTEHKQNLRAPQRKKLLTRFPKQKKNLEPNRPGRCPADLIKRIEPSASNI